MSAASPQTEYTLEALEGATGTSARTIRYYISQGLVPPPLTVGRTASYGDVHLAALKAVAEAKAKGMSLEAIKHQLHPPKGTSPVPTPHMWGVVPLAEDVVVSIKAGVPPWRKNQIDKALEAFMAVVTRKSHDSEEG